MTGAAPAGGNLSFQDLFTAWTPTMTGTTDNPVPTFTTQIGRFLLLGAHLLFKFRLVSSTMTKTTLTDLVQVTLPPGIPAATNTGEVTQFSARVENATAVANMNVGEIASAGTVITFRNYALAASSSQLTYAVTTPGIGVLTNTITLQGTGFYEPAVS